MEIRDNDCFNDKSIYSFKNSFGQVFESKANLENGYWWLTSDRGLKYKACSVLCEIKSKIAKNEIAVMLSGIGSNSFICDLGIGKIRESEEIILVSSGFSGIDNDCLNAVKHVVSNSGNVTLIDRELLDDFSFDRLVRSEKKYYLTSMENIESADDMTFHRKRGTNFTPKKKKRKKRK